MATCHLTADRLRELLDYDPETGVFTRKASRTRYGTTSANRATAGKQAGGWHIEGYVAISVDNRRYLAHRLAWLHVHGAWPEADIDHLNGVRTDNRIANLRSVTRGVNLQNLRAAQRNSKSGFLGVSWDERKQAWMARIGVNRRTVHLGRFKTAEEAHEAYKNAKRKLHDGCTI
jgi:hypothetical protein